MRPKEEDYFEYRGKFRIMDYGSCDNYIDAQDDYIDYLESQITELKSEITVLKISKI